MMPVAATLCDYLGYILAGMNAAPSVGRAWEYEFAKANLLDISEDGQLEGSAA